MTKYRLFISFWNKFLTLLLCLFFIFLLIFSNSNIFAAQNGLLLWAKHIIPSLFPFFVATELLNYTNISYYFSKFFERIMKPLFNVPGEASYAFIMGLLCGYPVGAKIINNFLHERKMFKKRSRKNACFYQ